MEGRKMEQARAAARYVLDHLGADDRFNIIGFGTGVRLFDAAPQPLSRLDEGRAFIDRLEAAGGTNISRALGEALAGADPVRPTIVIFMTDGLPTAGETDPDRIAEGVTGSAPKSTRLFAFGVGYDVDTVLLDQLSSALRGVSAYVKPGESIEEAVSGLYQKVSAPVLVDVEARFSGVQTDDLYPYPLPDLFAGNQLVVAGRYRSGGTASLDLTGTVDGQPQSYRYDGLRFVERGGDEFIPRLWAQRAVGYLLSQIRLHGANEELVKAIVDLSVRYGIITPYTSFLVEEPPQTAAQAPRPAGAPTEAPLGLAPGAAGAPTSAPAPVVIQTVVVEKEVEKLVAPAERSGAEAVQRAEVERELSTEGHAVLPGAPGEVRQVGDRAFVQRGAIWVDTSYDPAGMQAEAIGFGSDRYFELLAQHPDIGPYLALGQNIILVIEGRAYAIGPDAGVSASSTPAVRSSGATPPAALPAAVTAVPGTETAPAPQRGPAPCPGAASVLLAAVGVLVPLWRRKR
jgi:Ca-activated chloride channel family protein